MLCFYLIASAAFVFASPFPYDSNELIDPNAEIEENPDSTLLVDTSDATVARVVCTSPIGYNSDGNDPEEDSNTIFRRASECPITAPILKPKKPQQNPVSAPELSPASRKPAFIKNPSPSEKCPDASKSNLVTCGGPEIVTTTGQGDLFSDTVIDCVAGVVSEIIQRGWLPAPTRIAQYCCNFFENAEQLWRGWGCLKLTPGVSIKRFTLAEWQKYWLNINAPKTVHDHDY